MICRRAFMHACMPALFPGKCAHLVAVAANIGSAHSWLGQICMLLSCPFLPRYPGPGPSTPARATNYMDDLTGIGRSNPPTNTGHRAPVPCSLRFASRSSSVSLGPAEATKKLPDQTCQRTSLSGLRMPTIQTSSLLLAPDVIVISTVGFFKLTVMKIIIIAAQFSALVEHQRLARPHHQRAGRRRRTRWGVPYPWRGWSARPPTHA